MPTVRGKAEVRRYFASAPARINNVLRGAARAGGTVIADEIKRETPSDAVRDNVQIRTKTEDHQIRVTIDVKPGWGRSVGTWLEYGTSPHFISVDDSQREGRSVRRINELGKGGKQSLVIGGQFVGKTVFHPGARAHPTFRPALDIKGAEAVAAAQGYINARLSGGSVSAKLEDDDE